MIGTILSIFTFLGVAGAGFLGDSLYAWSALGSILFFGLIGLFIFPTTIGMAIQGANLGAVIGGVAALFVAGFAAMIPFILVAITGWIFTLLLAARSGHL